MNIKLTDLAALESLTIAAYGIPKKTKLRSKAKITQVSGKTNAFISGNPSKDVEADLELLDNSAQRISCTFSFGMDKEGFNALMVAFNAADGFEENEKNEENHRVFYVNKRKFTISYFDGKKIAMVYANYDLFKNSLAHFFKKKWQGGAENHGRQRDNNRRKDNSPATAKAVSTKSTKRIRGVELKKLPSAEPEAQAEDFKFEIQDLNFRINRLAITGHAIPYKAMMELQQLVAGSNNSVSMRSEEAKGHTWNVSLISNINGYLLKAMEVIADGSPQPVEMEIRTPLKTGIWKYISRNTWVEGVNQETTEDGFCLMDDDDVLAFTRNPESGVCDIKGNLTPLLATALERLDDIIDNNLGIRAADIQSVNESIRAKLPYTVKILKEKADQFVNLISPSFVLINDPEIELTDYSPMVFSVYRGVELYLKYLAELGGVDLKGKPVGELFKNSYSGKRYLKTMEDTLNGSTLKEIFENFGDYRNNLFHANLDEVVIIGSKKDAEDICITVLQKIETASFEFHLDEMSMTL